MKSRACPFREATGSLPSMLPNSVGLPAGQTAHYMPTLQAAHAKPCQILFANELHLDELHATGNSFDTYDINSC